ncbi:MAG: pyrroline-5-carboxylate reductase [Rhodospirillales bacterium]|nr:pyrroline-5-carboxylate reductase [Rhodospirillales bacterium]
MPRPTTNASIVLVGSGNMGSAMLDGWLAHGVPAASICVVEPAAANAAAAESRGVAVIDTPALLDTGSAPDVLVLAVKPQAMDSLLAAYAKVAAHGAVVLSIAAGKTIESLTQKLGASTAVVRAMPNTPASIRLGISVACANAHASKVQRARCDELLACVGNVLWVEDERLLDAVTAVSGSGPAYVFLLAECLAVAGREAGLPAALAERLARETVVGAGALLARSSLPFETLRGNVTSPGGTTAAALSILMADDGLQPLLSRAVSAATERARELAC